MKKRRKLGDADGTVNQWGGNAVQSPQRQIESWEKSSTKKKKKQSAKNVQIIIMSLYTQVPNIVFWAPSQLIHSFYIV